MHEPFISEIEKRNTHVDNYVKIKLKKLVSNLRKNY